MKTKEFKLSLINLMILLMIFAQVFLLGNIFLGQAQAQEKKIEETVSDTPVLEIIIGDGEKTGNKEEAIVIVSDGPDKKETDKGNISADKKSQSVWDLLDFIKSEDPKKQKFAAFWTLTDALLSSYATTMVITSNSIRFFVDPAQARLFRYIGQPAAVISNVMGFPEEIKGLRKAFSQKNSTTADKLTSIANFTSRLMIASGFTVLSVADDAQVLTIGANVMNSGFLIKFGLTLYNLSKNGLEKTFGTDITNQKRPKVEMILSSLIGKRIFSTVGNSLLAVSNILGGNVYLAIPGASLVAINGNFTNIGDAIRAVRKIAEPIKKKPITALPAPISGNPNTIEQVEEDTQTNEIEYTTQDIAENNC